MHKRHRPTGDLIFPALLGFVVGTALQLQQAALWSWTTYLIGLVLALLLWLAGKAVTGLTRSALLALACGTLALASTGLRASYYAAHTLEPALEGRNLLVLGVVDAMPQQSQDGERFRYAVESAQWQGRAVQLPSHLYLSWYANTGNHFVENEEALDAEADTALPGGLQAGERWQFTLRLKAPHGGSNPFGFDYELWLWEQGLQASGYVRSGRHDAPPKRLAQTYRHPIELARQQVREKIYQSVGASEFAGLIAALVVGDQNAINRSDWNIFRATGVAHLMSISGLHITMFAWLAALLVGWLWRRSASLCLRWPATDAALLGGIFLATLYALFSGWGVPSQRTILMLATVGLLRVRGKRWPWPLVWLLACAVVVAVDPWALLQAGFWLSFVAVGILFASDSDSGPPRGVLARLRADWHEQWLITLALTPLVLLLFGQVSLVGLAANAVAIPVVTLLITPLAMLGVLLPVLWQMAAWVVSGLLWYLHWLAALPFATLTLAQAPLWAGVVSVLGGLLLALPLPWRLRLLGLPLLLPVCLWQVPRPLPGQFDLLAADVGQGNAVLVRTERHALMYDSGPRFGRDSDAGERVLVPLLRALDEHLDTLIISHRDSDHTGGALALLAMQPQATLLSSIEDDNVMQATRHAQRCIQGQHWRWDGVDFDILHPSAADYALGRKSNAMSCVLRISNSQRSALLVADIEQPQEAQLLAQPTALQSDLLLVPHHGSKTSSSDAFLAAVQPRLALVQAGYRNRFGHPAASVMARYAQHGIAVVLSPRCGAARWLSTQPEQVNCQREQARRYWQHQF